MSNNNISVLNGWSPFLADSFSFCSCPPETSDTVSDTDEVDGGILFIELPVDIDLPFCPFCELAQLDVEAPYSCQCEDF